jgi:hypothetical protein
MSDKIFLVTAPDDVLEDGFRVLLVDLTTEQNEFISSILGQLEFINKAVFYIWHATDSVEWLLDKKQKSNLIIFNAESENHTIAGYMSAQPNSHYLGTLRDLNISNKSVINDKEVLVELLEKEIGKYEGLFK